MQMIKRISLLIVTWLLIAIQPLQAQSIFDSLKKTAEMENERRGWSDNSTMSAEEKVAWEEKWRKKIDGSAEMLAAFDPHGSCVAMMVLYVYDYKKLLATTNREQDCKRKYDLYGMQLLSLASSTNILYCPEGLSKLTASQREQVERGYWETLRNRQPADTNAVADVIIGMDETGQDDGRTADPWVDLMRKSASLSSQDLIGDLVQYFTPVYVGTQTLAVASKMEALGCAP